MEMVLAACPKPCESPSALALQDTAMTRHVTAESLSWELVSGRDDPAQRFRIYCRDHAGELTLIATCGTPEAVGLAIITLGREHEFEDCALGILDVLGEKGE